MSFNMKHSTSSGKYSWNHRRMLILRAIRTYSPDLLGTQELTIEGIRDLQKALPEYGWRGIGREGGDKGEFSAIFYRKDRFRCLDSRTFWLSKTPQRPSRGWMAVFPRICTVCTLSPREYPRCQIHFYNTHLDHVSGLARLNGLRLILNDMVSQAVGFPIILTGDFNATPTSWTIRQWEKYQQEQQETFLRGNWLTNPGLSLHNYRGGTAGEPIDHIYTSPEFRVEEIKICRDTFHGRYPSDHYPVVAHCFLTIPAASGSPVSHAQN